MMDWNAEADKLGDKGVGRFFKAKGFMSYKITFLDEGVEKEHKFPTGDKPVPQVSFRIKNDGEEQTWDVSKSVMKTSLYGQIALVARANDGRLTGLTIILNTIGESMKDRKYFIQEALHLMAKEEKVQAK